MKDIKRTLAGLMAVMSVMSAAASCTQKQTNGSPEEPTEIPTEAAEAAVETPTEDPIPFRGTTLTWLGDFDLNQTSSGGRSVAMALFEDRYGCTVNCIQTDASQKYERLSSMINSGEEVDMFPFDDNAVPGRAAAGQFEARDPYFYYLGYDEGLWDDMKSTADMLAYNGSHYVMPTSLTDPFLLTYSRTLMQAEGLEDPWQLYQQGTWDWNAFLDMMKTFKANGTDGKTRYGVNGWFGRAALQSTGHTVVNMTAAGCENNIADPAIAGAEQMMQDVVQNGLFSSYFRRWFPNDQHTLFLASGDWTVGASNAKNPDGDIMVVPFPKAPDADKYYLTCGFNAKLLVKNSKHPEAVAAYLRCERIAATQEEYVTAAKEKALVPVPGASGEPRSQLTEEQYDAIQSIMRDCTPVYDPGYGMGEKMYTIQDEKLSSRGAMNRITEDILRQNAGSWDSLRDLMSPAVDAAVGLVNSGQAADHPAPAPEPEEVPAEEVPAE